MANEDLFEQLAKQGPAGPQNLLTEDEILTAEDKKKPEPSQATASSKPKKACANCTCGLAEELEKKEKDTDKAKEPKSSCGSCYLGDAFRCASCPHRGTPAFKPGDKVTIDLGSDD